MPLVWPLLTHPYIFRLPLNPIARDAELSAKCEKLVNAFIWFNRTISMFGIRTREASRERRPVGACMLDSSVRFMDSPDQFMASAARHPWSYPLNVEAP